MRKLLIFSCIFLVSILSGCSDIKSTVHKSSEELVVIIKENTSVKEGSNAMKEIYLAGGCFWGVEKYLSLINGVTHTEVGYANGRTERPTYEEVCYQGTGHAETVKVMYDPDKISLYFLLELFYDIIDPTTVNRQGPDVGEQYRTGIYYVDDAEREIVLRSIADLQKLYNEPVAIELKKLENYYRAEEYHQGYLGKNPAGYCHIRNDKFRKAGDAVDKNLKYRLSSKEELSQKLSKIQFEVTQENATEPPFKNEYFAHFKPGIYVDITTGEPLFVSSDKFESGCGWPAFSKPIDKEAIVEVSDKSYGMIRTEVRSRHGNAHLGHVFNDGPKEMGGMRYCINSASLRFIPKEQMEGEGYGYLLPIIKQG